MSAHEGVRVLRTVAVAAALVISVPAAGEAQRPGWLGFRGNLGTEIPRGDPDEVFQGNIRGEFSVLFAPRGMYPLHFGVGFGWVSYPIEPGFPSDEQWNHVGLHLLLALTFKEWIRLPLYVEARLIERRLRPIETRYFEISSEQPIKDTPFTQYWGMSGEGLIGVELPLGASVAMDLSGRIGGFAPRVENDPDLVPIRHGWTFGTQLGLIWFP